MNDDVTIVVITGPTATGKTSIALEIAQRIPVTIVCADSRQVYTMMDIGTAKPTNDEMASCPHRLFNIRHPRQDYNAGEYATDLRKIVEEGSGTFLVVGGSGLYLQAALDGLSTTLAETDPAIRSQVQGILDEQGKEALYQWLQKLDAKAALLYADKNPRRLQRAIEYALQTGNPISSTWDVAGTPIACRVARYVVDRSREELHQRIDARCEQMWQDGLLRETENILAQDVSPAARSLQTVGYTQALRVLGHGEPLTKEQAITEHKTATRQYAKRQRTWFRKDPRYTWLESSKAFDIIMKSLPAFLMTLCLVGLTTFSTNAGAVTDSSSPTLKPSYRIASQFDSTRALNNLADRLNVTFSSKAFRNTKAGCRVWNITRNRLVYDYHGEQRLTPASTTKLFSTAAAFHALGADGALVTEIRATGRLLTNGTLEGDLYLVGMGDAMLTVNDLEIMADELFAMGVRNIRGKVHGDGSFFDNVTNRAVYSGDGEVVQAMPPVSALCLNEGKLAIVVSASRNGNVTAQCIPANDAVTISIVPSAPTKRRRRRARLSVTSSVGKDGIQHITVAGTPGARRSKTVFVAMADPALVCAGTLASRLRAGGVSVGGGIGTARFSTMSRVMVRKSRPLIEFCSVVNKHSHNYFAEQIFKVVGGQYGGRANTAEVAKKAILATLDSLRIQRRGTVLNDGSGLSRRNLTCPATQVDLLRAVYNRPYGAAFMTTLAIAGVDGTIRNRMRGTPGENNVHAKTGTLRNTSALSGYVTTLDGELWCFSILSNGPYTRSYKAAENQIAAALAGFSYSERAWTPEPGIKVNAPATSDIELLDTGVSDEDADILDSLVLPKQSPRPTQAPKRKYKP